MEILKRLDTVVELAEQARPIEDVFSLIGFFKKYLRRRYGKFFIKIVSDTTETGELLVFIKFSKIPWGDADNEKLSNSPLNFIICISGFDLDGSVSEGNAFEVEMFKIHDPNKTVKKMRHKRFFNVEDARGHVLKYFNTNEESLLDEEGAVATGTASGATGFADGGIERTVGDIAVKPYHGGIYRRSGEVKKKKRIKEEFDSSEDMTGGVPYYVDEDRIFALLKVPPAEKETQIQPPEIAVDDVTPKVVSESVLTPSKDKFKNRAYEIVDAELGLKSSDIKDIYKVYEEKDGDRVKLEVYAMEVEKGVPIYKHDEDVEKVVWVNDVDFQLGREQHEVLEHIFSKIREKLEKESGSIE